MNRTKIGIDYLTENAYTAGVKSEKIMANINSNNKLIEVFSSKNMTPEEYEKSIKNVNEMLNVLENKMAEIVKLAAETDKEYLAYKTKDYLKFNIPKSGANNKINIRKLLPMNFVALLLICVYFILTQKIREMRMYR